MKQILFTSITAFLLSGCFGSPVNGSSNSESDSDLESKNLNHGGEGSQSDPFTIGNGAFGTKSTSVTTYYDFKVSKASEDSCGLIIYDSTQFDKDVNLSTASGYSNVKKNEFYQIYNSVNDGTYNLSSKEANKSDKFALYSNCISSTYNYKLIDLADNSTYEFSEYFKLYRIILTSKQDIKLENVNNIDEFVLLNKDFSIHSDETSLSTFRDTLDKGTYYLLFKGKKESSIKASFKYEITDN